MGDEIVVSDVTSEIIEYIEINNPSTGIVDGAGDMVVISERNSNIPIISPPFIAENSANKKSDLNNPNATTYPNTLAVANALEFTVTGVTNVGDGYKLTNGVANRKINVKSLKSNTDISIIENDSEILIGFSGSTSYLKNDVFIEYSGNTDNKIQNIEDNYQQYLSAGVFTKPNVVNNGDGTITLGTGEYVLYSDNSFNYPLTKYVLTGGTYSFENNKTNYIVVSLVNNIPEISVIINRNSINQSSIHPIITVFRLDNDLRWVDWDSMGKGLSNKITDRLVRVNRFEVESNGLIIGEESNRVVTLSDGVVWYGGVNVVLPECNSSTDIMELWFNSGGNWEKNIITEYNNNNYDDGNGLVELPDDSYGVNWVFRGIENTKRLYIILGNTGYTQNGASVAKFPSTIPPILQSQSIYVGKITVLKNANISNEIISAFNLNVNGTPITDHNQTSNIQGGLSDERYHIDYNKYLFIDALSGWTGTTTQNSNFISHTGDTNIHYEQSGITINENQVRELVGKYSQTGHTHSKENLIGLKILDSPEFADVNITSLSPMISGGTIDNSVWTWWNLLSKSILNSIESILTYIFNRKDEDSFYFRRLNEPFTSVIKLDRDVTQYINYTLTGDTQLSIASTPTPVMEATAEGVLIGNGTALLTLSGISYWATSPEYDKTLDKQNHYMIWKQGDGVYIFITQKN